MKSFFKIAIVILLLVPGFVQSQDSRDLMLFFAKHHQAFFIDIAGDTGTVIKIVQQYDVAGRYYLTEFYDVVVKNVQNPDQPFFGKYSSIDRIRDQYFLRLYRPGMRKGRKFKLDTVVVREAANKEINQGIWWNRFLDMVDKFNKKYPLQHYSFRNGFMLWDSIQYMKIDYRDFPVRADQVIGKIRDSLIHLNAPRAELSGDLIENAGRYDYDTLKRRMLQLPMEYRSHSAYLSAVLLAVADRRPEFFFRLCEDLPENREMFFFTVFTDKKIRRKIKRVESNSPMKKELVKYFRKQTAGIIFTTGLYVAVIGGVTYLIIK